VNQHRQQRSMARYVTLTNPVPDTKISIMPSYPFDILEHDELPSVSAEFFNSVAHNAVREKGVVHIAVSGGSTPRGLFRLLATPEWRDRIPWAQLHLWWVDERCVPPDDPNSNYGVVFHLLLQHLSVSNVHRIHAEMPDPVQAASIYEEEISRVFQLGLFDWPRFDLIMLGMGSDGHTASLFPDTPALDESKALVTVGKAPALPHQRITLTFPVLNNADCVLFMVTGAGKGPALTQVFSPPPNRPLLPAARVKPGDGRLLWLLDESAAIAAGLAS
jgi:6-phosphogluconolactonase